MPDRHEGPVSAAARLVIALATAAFAWALADRVTALTAFLLFCVGTSATAPRWTGLLRVAPLVALVGGSVLGALLMLAAEALYGLDALRIWHYGVLVVVSMALTTIAAGISSRRSRGPTRIAVIGSGPVAEALAGELEASRCDRYAVVGWIAVTDEYGSSEPGGREGAALGSIEELPDVVRRERIGLVVMTGEVPRMRVFSQLADGPDQCEARVIELSSLYEEVFGHVPVGEINAAWFQYAMHPEYRPPHPHLKRALDTVVASLGLLVALPLLAVVVPLIRRDGGPAIFSQVRIGDGGRPFVMLKLRTMALGTDQSAQWTSISDPRVTRIGRLLRRFNLDELPQFVNVLRGEMSLVGPRPEQPEFVERLEQIIPFYQRRHLIKPGITGWAQIRCGYIRSDRGSAWKLCHDLYYIKHRSMLLDLAILVETILTVFRGPVYGFEPGPRSIEFAHVDKKGLILAG